MKVEVASGDKKKDILEQKTTTLKNKWPRNRSGIWGRFFGGRWGYCTVRGVQLKKMAPLLVAGGGLAGSNPPVDGRSCSAE